MTTGAEEYVAQYPTPDEFWNRVFVEQIVWRDRFAASPDLFLCVFVSLW